MRILHTMIRVGDLERSVHFYTKVMEMNLHQRQEYPEGRFTLAFVGYGDEGSQPTIELTYNWDVDGYEKGDGFGHIAVEVENIYEAVERIRQSGAKIVREAGPMRHGSTVVAFLEDPDGYKIELLQRQQ